MDMQLSAIQFGICFRILLREFKYLIQIVTDGYCCMEWFNPPTHRSVCSDTLD